MLLKLFLCRRSQTFEHVVRMDSLIGIWNDIVWFKYLVFCRIEKTLTLWMDYIGINHMKTFLSSLNRMMSWQKILTNDVNIAPGSTPINKQYRYVPLHRVRFIAPFWSENGSTLCPFWSGIGYGFQGNYRSVWTYLSFQFQMSKKERETWEFEMDLNNFFVCALIQVKIT